MSAGVGLRAGGGVVLRHCERSEAIHSSGKLDCFVANASRNDADENAIRNHKTKRALGMSATQHPQRPLFSEARLGPEGFPSSGSRRNSSLQLQALQLGLQNSSPGKLLIFPYSSGSSPSASRSGEPARICSAIRPEFCRIAASILAVISGLSRRNPLAFSRPCPRRWLS